MADRGKLAVRYREDCHVVGRLLEVDGNEFRLDAQPGNKLFVPRDRVIAEESYFVEVLRVEKRLDWSQVALARSLALNVLHDFVPLRGRERRDHRTEVAVADPLNQDSFLCHNTNPLVIVQVEVALHLTKSSCDGAVQYSISKKIVRTPYHQSGYAGISGGMCVRRLARRSRRRHKLLSRQSFTITDRCAKASAFGATVIFIGGTGWVPPNTKSRRDHAASAWFSPQSLAPKSLVESGP